MINSFYKSNETNESMADKIYDKIHNKFLLGNKLFFREANSREKRIPYLIPKRKIFHPNKKSILEIENFKPIYEARKEIEQIMKQNYINYFENKNQK